MKFQMKHLIAAATLGLGLATTPLVHAQDASKAQQAAPQQQAPAAIDPSDKQIDQYVEATKKVSDISSEYQPKLESAKDDSERTKIMQEADKEMVSEVNDIGLSVDDYNGITMAIQQDEELRKKVEERLAN